MSHRALGDQFKGQVVRIKDMSGMHPDFSDSGDRYYVAGRAIYSNYGGLLHLKGIPGHTNGSVDGISPDKIERAPKGEKIKKYRSDY